MFSRKLLVVLLTIAIIGTTAIVLGCTSPTPTAAPTSNPSPTATPNPLSGHILVAGSSSVGPHVDKGTNYYNAFVAAYPNVQVDVSISDSGTGIKAVSAGTCDVGMSSRALTSAETDSGLVGTIIAYDGIAIIVNPANTVTNLSKEQIKEIFAGNITSWKQVGGSDAAITVFQREASSGTRSAFFELVMEKKVNVTSNALQASNTLNMIQSVKGNPNAIGYVSFGEMSSDVKALQVGGITISAASIKDKTYTIQRPFLLVTKGQASGAAKAYIDFALSANGQNILAQDNLIKV